MDEQQKIDWAQQHKKLLLLLEKQQALPTDHPFSIAKLDEEILAVEEAVRSCQVLRASERLSQSHHHVPSKGYRRAASSV